MAGQRRGRLSEREFLALGKEFIRKHGQDYVHQLKQDGINLLSTLRQRSRRFPEACFFCPTCNYHIHSEDDMEEHRVSHSHRRKLKEAVVLEKMKRIRSPKPVHLRALDSHLTMVYDSVRLSEESVAARVAVVTDLEAGIQENIKLADVRLVVTGSVKSGFALKDSDTNIRLVKPKAVDYLTVFTEIYGFLQRDDDYNDTILDLESRFPFISFKHSSTAGMFLIYVNDEGKHHSHVILSVYSRWHPKVKQLGVLLKHLAKQGGITDVERGGLLPMCMPILAVYFCQQAKLLPVFINSSQVLDATQEQLEEFIEQVDGRQGSASTLETQSISNTWIKLLKFFSGVFAVDLVCVSILSGRKVTKEDKSWPTRNKRLAIEEPGLPKRNLSSVVSNHQVLDFIVDYLRDCYVHFGDPMMSPPEEEMSVEERFIFSFNSLAIYREKFPVFCRECHEEGHTAVDCPPEELPECEELDELSDGTMTSLNKLLLEIKEQNQLTEEERNQRDEIVQHLTELIQHRYPDAQLELYGSSVNGLGSFTSDMDISMVLAGRETMGHEEKVKVILSLVEIFKRSRRLADVAALINLPLIKFFIVDNKVEADLTLYNRLASQNTSMIRRYCEIDERVRTLGYCVKVFAKERETPDALEKTLKSYAYVLMMIYYLQRCDPPVLPVLQELYEGDSKPERMFEEWNTWYYEGDNQQLRTIWPGFGANKQTEAELWVDFLDFYSQRFDYKKHVVSIRTSAAVSKMEKMWNSNKLAVEDPFNTDHNLAVALSKKSNGIVLSNLVIGRNIFGSETIGPTGDTNLFKDFFRNGRYVKQPARKR